MSRIPQKETKKAQDGVFAGEPIAADEKSDDEPMVESEEDAI